MRLFYFNSLPLYTRLAPPTPGTARLLVGEPKTASSFSLFLFFFLKFFGEEKKLDDIISDRKTRKNRFKGGVVKRLWGGLCQKKEPAHTVHQKRSLD